ncbi:MAG: DUF1836 domain-containing protein [Traorella sp.]
MENKNLTAIQKALQQFSLPSYQEIPDVGFYLDQSVKYINQIFSAIPNMEITSSMISNYVKKGIIERPIKKCYSRNQICYLIFIVIGKNVLSMENIQILFAQQKKTYSEEIAYEYFREELKNALYYVCGLKEQLDPIGVTDSETKSLLRNTIMSVSYKIYLELNLEAIKNK